MYLAVLLNAVLLFFVFSAFVVPWAHFTGEWLELSVEDECTLVAEVRGPQCYSRLPLGLYSEGVSWTLRLHDPHDRNKTYMTKDVVHSWLPHISLHELWVASTLWFRSPSHSSLNVWRPGIVDFGKSDSANKSLEYWSNITAVCNKIHEVKRSALWRTVKDSPWILLGAVFSNISDPNNLVDAYWAERAEENSILFNELDAHLASMVSWTSVNSSVSTLTSKKIPCWRSAKDRKRTGAVMYVHPFFRLSGLILALGVVVAMMANWRKLWMEDWVPHFPLWHVGLAGFLSALSPLDVLPLVFILSVPGLVLTHLPEEKAERRHILFTLFYSCISLILVCGVNDFLLLSFPGTNTVVSTTVTSIVNYYCYYGPVLLGATLLLLLAGPGLYIVFLALIYLFFFVFLAGPFAAVCLAVCLPLVLLLGLCIVASTWITKRFARTTPVQAPPPAEPASPRRRGVSKSPRGRRSPRRLQ